MKRAIGVLRWTGRIWSLASLAFLLSFALGSRESPTAAELVGLALFPGGVAAGLLIGWWREGPGGAIVVLSFAAFYFWSASFHGGFPRGPWFLLVSAPGPILLLCALVEDFRRPAGPSRSPGT